MWASFSAMAACSVWSVDDVQKLLRCNQPMALELSERARTLPYLGILDVCWSIRMPVTIARNSSGLLLVMLYAERLMRHALPEDQEYPPMPVGQASAIIMLDG